MEPPKKVVQDLKVKLTDVKEKLRFIEKELRQDNDRYMKLRRLEAEYQSAINALLNR